MNFGILPQELQIIENIFRNSFTNIKNIRVYIFGSRAKGTNQKYSDIDLLIECDELTPMILSLIVEQLENSMLPYKVDLVDSRKLSPEYAESVHSTKKILFEIL